MTPTRLARLSLWHYWRSNAAVVAGVAVAVSVLAGALLVGESVRRSLREIAIARLGNTTHLVASTGFFRQALADDLRQDQIFESAFEDAVGLIAVDGLVSHGSNGRRASQVAVYGVNPSFWAFHQRDVPGGAPSGREALLSPALARELDAAASDGVLIRLQQPSAIPAGTLHGRRDELGRTLRASVRAPLSPEHMGEFSLRPQQGDVRAIFLPLDRLQRDLNRDAQINALLVAEREPVLADSGARLTRSLDRVRQLDDAGLRIRRVPQPDGAEKGGAAPQRSVLSLESDAGLLTDRVAERAKQAAQKEGLQSLPVLSYLAHTIRVGTRSLAYSVVAAMDLDRYPQLTGRDAEAYKTAVPAGGVDPIWLNEWAAQGLEARPGDTVTIEYDSWVDGGGIVSRSATFTVAGVLPMRGVGADPTLTPEYPGISEHTNVADWDPPFPIDLSRITPRDEAYWDEYRAAPRGFISFAAGERLWAGRFGRMTSLRLFGPPGASASDLEARFRRALTTALTLEDAGFVVQPVRARALEASSGTTDFGQYFLYFSFFLVVSGLLLAGLFFRLGIEQRLREIGLLQAVGLAPGAVRGIFLREGLAIAIAGALVGCAGAVLYAWLMMVGLRTWWVDAVGTTALTLRPSPTALVAGALGGLVTAVVVIAWTLRQVLRVPPSRLLKGFADTEAAGAAGDARRVRRGRARVLALAMTFVTVLLFAASFGGGIDPTAGFFGAGAAALAAALFTFAWLIRRNVPPPSPSARWRGLARFGVSNAGARPGRSVLAVALIAFATFVIVAVGAFRRGDVVAADRASGTGGYTIIAESVAPLMYDPMTPAGREAYGLDSPDLQPLMADPTIDRFRLRPGDDGSCLNLYRPEHPRLLAPMPEFVSRGGRFTFAAALAESDEEQRNPWLLLNRPMGDVVPAIVDATSLNYVFHRGLGDEIEIARAEGRPVRLRFVASLSHSLFQSELLISEANFVRLFPEIEGYRMWLVESNPDRVGDTIRMLEERLSDFGLEASETQERLRAYQQVENTYLSTFQALGALGLVLGTLGLGALLLRNVFERQREVALLQAVGYRTAHVRGLIVSEALLIVFAGLVIGSVCALVAVQPAVADHGGTLPVGTAALVFAAVTCAGLVAAVAATAVTVRLPLLTSLKAE